MVAMIHILVCGLCLLMVPLVQSQEKGWQHFGNLRESRSHFFACLISPNEILIVGGYSRGKALSSCEILDTETGEVRLTEPMRIPRWLFAPVVVGDSLLFVFGGATSDGLTSIRTAEVFNFRTRTWSDAGQLRSGRSQIVAAYDGVNTIVIVGGRIGTSAYAYADVYHHDGGRLQPAASFPYATSLGAAVVGPSGEVLFFGGRSGGPGSFRSRDIHQYDFGTEQFVVWGQQADSVYLPLATRLASGQVVVTGGALAETNNNQNTLVNTVSVLQKEQVARVVARMQQPRILHSAVELDRNRLLIVGGESPSSEQLRSCELAVLDSGVVRPFYPLNEARSWFQLVPIMQYGRMRVFAIGGRIGGSIDPTTTSSIEVLELCAGSSTSAPIGELAYNGDARREASGISLTRLQRFSAGSIWKPYVGSPTRDGFHHRIKARLANGDNRNDPESTSPGADGITFVIQRSGVNALGEAGRGIGYSGIRHGVAVEFDAFVNFTNADPPAHHLAVMKPVADTLTAIHSPSSTVATTVNIPNIVSDSTPFFLDYHYLNRKLTVTLSNDGTFDRHSLVVEDINIDSLIGLTQGVPYFVGFTAATGIAVQDHIIDEWLEFSCLEPLNTTSVHEPGPGDPVSNPSHESLSLGISPSPATSMASVTIPPGQGAPTTLAVYDVRGSEVYRYDFHEAVPRVDIPVARLASGMYVVHVHTRNTTLTGLLPVSR